MKIRKDYEYTSAEKGDASINIYMSQNEKEGAQIIMTPSEDVSSYDVELSDLTCGDNVISKENIEVFNQHYMETNSQSNKYHELGWYPDALVPFKNAKDAEENVITAGDNQGLWFRVETTENTPAGAYTGEFTLTVDGTEYDIPVTVNVWDFAIPENEWPKTMFNLWLTYLSQGEYENGVEMWEKYFEFFLDYGIVSNGLMIEGLDAQSFIYYLRKYWDRLPCYNLPSTIDYSSNDGALHFGYDYEETEYLVKALVKASKEDGVDYLSKAYIYNFYIDEYHATWAFGDTRIKDATYFATEIAKTWDKVEEYFDVTYGTAYIDSVAGLRQSLNDIGIVSVNGTWIDGTTDLFNVWCPNTISLRENILEEKFALANDSTKALQEIWWYTTIGCDYPVSPGYQIDDPLVDERIMSWMQYDFGIEGNMMWASNLYSGKEEYGLSPTDEWIQANRCTGGNWNGDGFQVYPGYKYGIDGPIGTIRLENIRDGMEEYKYLKVLEGLYENLSVRYGVELDTHYALQPTFNSLYDFTAPNYDVDNFENQRHIVANHIARAKGDVKLAYCDYEESLNDFKISIVLDKSYTVTSEYLVGNGKLTENGVGKVYDFVVSKNTLGEVALDFTYTNGSESETIKVVLAEGGLSLVDFDDVADQQYLSIKGENGTAFNNVETVSGVLAQKITFNTYVGFNSLMNRPYFEFDVATIKALASNVKCYYLDLYNASSEEIKLEVYCISTKQDNIVNIITLPANTWTRVKISDVNVIYTSDQLRFSFSNAADATSSGATSKTYQIYVSRFAYSAK